MKTCSFCLSNKISDKVFLTGFRWCGSWRASHFLHLTFGLLYCLAGTIQLVAGRTDQLLYCLAGTIQLVAGRTDQLLYCLAGTIQLVAGRTD
jgi:hypothetical protein